MTDIEGDEKFARARLKDAQRSLEYAMNTIGTDHPDITALSNAIQHITHVISTVSATRCAADGEVRMRISFEFTEDELELVMYALVDAGAQDLDMARDIRGSLSIPEYVASLPPGVEGELEGSAESYEEDAAEYTVLADRMKTKLKQFQENKRSGDEG